MILMILHRKCVICFVILCTLGCVTRCSESGIRTNYVSEDSDEDEKLKQALVLVNLLKIEYAKALRENHELRQKGSTLTDDATCASTDEPTTASISSAHSQQPDSIAVGERVSWRRMAGLSTQPSQESPKENGPFQPHKFFRRRFPVDYYYVPFRRENEGDSSTATESTVDRSTETATVPSLTNRDVQTDAATTDAVSEDVAPTGKTDPVNKGTSVATNDTVSKGAPAATTHTATNTRPETQTKAVLLEDTTIDNIIADTTMEISEPQNKEDDPVMSQVADELIQELKPDKPKRKPDSTRRSIKIKLNSFMKLVKPTLKIHLGGSTRFPIPFPQNHAFCYTNPRNALCRTSI